MLIQRRNLLRTGIAGALLAALSSCGAVEPAFAEPSVHPIAVLKRLWVRLAAEGWDKRRENREFMAIVDEWMQENGLELPVTFSNGTTLKRFTAVPDEFGQVALFMIFSNSSYQDGEEFDHLINIQPPPIEAQKAA